MANLRSAVRRGAEQRRKTNSDAYESALTVPITKVNSFTGKTVSGTLEEGAARVAANSGQKGPKTAFEMTECEAKLAKENEELKRTIDQLIKQLKEQEERANRQHEEMMTLLRELRQIKDKKVSEVSECPVSVTTEEMEMSQPTTTKALPRKRAATAKKK